MRYEKVYVEEVAYVVPEIEVTTESIERLLGRVYQRVGVKPGLLQTLTGIHTRRFWEEGVRPSDGATAAAERLLGASAIPRSEVEVVVSTSVCKDYLEPSVASLVHGNLGLGSGCLNFDVGNACLGFMTGMTMVANLIELGQIEVGLVVAGEGSRDVTKATVERLMKPGVDFAALRDNFASLTLGSGSAAMLLVHERRARAGHRVLGGVSLAATEHNRLCVGTATSMTTDAAKLLAEGVKLAERAWRQVQQELELAVDGVAEFAMHQVGKANHEALVRQLALPDERALRLFPELGNVGAAGVPLTLAKAIELGRVREGSLVALMGIGSGLNCAMLGVRW